MRGIKIALAVSSEDIFILLPDLGYRYRLVTQYVVWVAAIRVFALVALCAHRANTRIWIQWHYTAHHCIKLSMVAN